MQHRTHDHCLQSSYEHRKPTITPQSQHQSHGPARLVILPVLLEMGEPMCVCLVCLVCLVCVFSVCVCVCLVYVCV